MANLSKAAAECILGAEKIARGDAKAEDISEKREHKRHEFAQDIPSVWLGEGGSSHKMVTMRSTDISTGGMCLTARSMVYKGQRGAVRLCIPGRPPVVVGVEALHCRYAGQMRYVIGCRFEEAPALLKNLQFIEKDGELQAVW